MRPRSLFFALLLSTGAALAAPRVLQPDPDQWLEAAVQGWSEGRPPPQVLALREQNPEWDFMARTFLVLALADRALEGEEAEELLAAMDTAIADTLAQEAAHGHGWYLLPYAGARPWRAEGRSLFVDGELLVMLGARDLVARELGLPERWGEERRVRGQVVADSFGAASSLPLAESYPDEGWTFCHAMALVGLRMHEELDGADHGALRQAWIEAARTRLLDADSGLLVSEFDMDGRVHDGVEGSSLFFVVTALQLVDPALAAEQYAGARLALGRSFMGWGYAREWPEHARVVVDVDSGPLVPGLEASASASGFAIAASAAHGDHAWNEQLQSALGAAETVMAASPGLAQAADNPLGQAVVLWGLGFGPLWELISPPG